MITWLASYPRSGNTYTRIVMNRLYGITTQSAYYRNDGVAHILGQEMVGAVSSEEDLLTEEQLAASPTNWIVKTHRITQDDYPAIYIVRDGRDCIVSWAHLELRDANYNSDDEYNALFEAKLMTAMNSESSTGYWGKNVCAWLDRIKTAKQPHYLMRFEDLIQNPESEIEKALQHVGFDFVRNPAATIPSFQDLQQHNSTFFRKGIVGSYIDELPEHLHAYFWSGEQTQRAMKELGY